LAVGGGSDGPVELTSLLVMCAALSTDSVVSLAQVVRRRSVTQTVRGFGFFFPFCLHLFTYLYGFSVQQRGSSI